MKKFIFLTIQFFAIIGVKAQSDVDILRYALSNNLGTARNIGLGNTMGSIGADLSVLSSNPAGIAKFNSTEIALSPSISFYKSSTNYLGNSLSDNKTKFTLDNAGIVFANKYISKKNKINIAFGINKLANYNESFFMSGYNEKNSIVNNFYETLENNALTNIEAQENFPFDASLAYLTDLITSDSFLNFYTATNNGNVQQDITIDRKGGMNEAAIGIAGIAKEKVMWGIGIGMPILNYSQETIFKETDSRDSAFDFNYFTYNNRFKSNGIGVNAKFGIIYSPINNLRLSVAMQTPSLLFITDKYYASINADYNSQTAEAISPDGESNYQMRLPWKLTTGASYLHKFGLIAVEYELTDISSSKYKFKNATTDTKFLEANINEKINQKYTLTHTAKIGIEGKFDKFRVRGGFQYRTSPFQNAYQPSNAIQSFTFSGGIGYRTERFFVDAVYAQTKTTETYVPYTLNNQTVADAKFTQQKPAVTLTFGLKF